MGRKLWGNPLLEQWGVVWLRRISTLTPIELWGDYLDLAEQEAKIIQQHIQELAEATTYNIQTLQYYLQTLLDAIQIAKDANGTVFIG